MHKPSSRKRGLIVLAHLALLTSACGGLAGSAATATVAATPTSTARSAQLSELQNTVDARDPGSVDWRAAAEGQQIAAGGRVKTGEAARAKVSLSDGTTIRLAPTTEFVLAEFSPQPADPVTRLQLAAGKMWVIVTRDGMEAARREVRHAAIDHLTPDRATWGGDADAVPGGQRRRDDRIHRLRLAPLRR